VAGVPRIAMCVPAPGGEINPLVLAAAHLAGVDEIYPVGGAQAIAALAFGTETIRPVAKIMGPGNAYVAAAKRQVFGTVGIDMIAGPSEVLIVADAESDPNWIAADLLAQAEHDEAAQAILITDDAALADAAEAAVERQLALLPRRDVAGASWRDNGAIILVGSLDETPALIDRIGISSEPGTRPNRPSPRKRAASTAPMPSGMSRVAEPSSVRSSASRRARMIFSGLTAKTVAQPLPRAT
jgi:histidinol dehydrogenase